MTIQKTKPTSVFLLFLFTTILLNGIAYAQVCTSEVGSGLCPGNPPNRIDLLTMCTDNPATPDVFEFQMTFNDSDPDGYGCAFFDTDNDGNANFAACTSTEGTEETLFSCNDTKSSLCPSFSVVSAPSFLCTATNATVTCSIATSALPTSAFMTNICSITSNNGADPNGTCKDCVVQGGTIKIDKVATDANGNTIPAGSSPMFSFSVTGGAMSPANVSVLGSGSTSVSKPTGQYSVSETVPSGWSFQSASCIDNTGNSDGTSTGTGVNGITLISGEVVICTFNNNENAGPSLHLEKSGTPSTYSAVGETIQYSYEVDNTGNVNVFNLSVHDDKICPTSAPCISCTSSTLAEGAVTTCGPVNYTITQDDLNNGNVTNTAYADSLYGANVQLQSNQDTFTATASVTRDITIDKTGTFNDGNGNSLADAGESISYSVTVTNSGSVTTTISSVSDPLIPSIGTNCIPALPAVLNPGEQTVCTGTYTITQSDIDATEVFNTATACTDVPNSNPLCKDASHTVDLPVNNVLDIDKSGIFDDNNLDGIAQPGETISYTIKLQNLGNTTLTNVNVNDPVLGVILCTPNIPASLAPLETMTCTGSYIITQSDIDAGSKTNTASGTSNETGEVKSTNVEPLPQRPDLSISKSGVFNNENGDTSAQQGETITYTIIVTNTGNITLTSLVVNDPIIGPLTCPGFTTGDSLAPGSQISCTANYTITALDIADGNKMNIASTGSTQVGPKTDDEKIILLAPTPTATATHTPTETPTSTPT